MSNENPTPSKQACQFTEDLCYVLDALNARKRPVYADKVVVDVAAIAQVVAQFSPDDTRFR